MKSTKEKETFSSLRSEGAQRREREQRRRMQRIIPLLMFGVVALLIAREEIPAVDSWISRLLDADAWNAGEACRQAAMAGMEQADYARLLDPGKVEKTSAGYYVGGVEFANLQSTGEEIHYRYSCNVSSTGEVLALNRKESSD
jgi:hypothetical protein